MPELTIHIPYHPKVSKNHCFIAGDRRRGYVSELRGTKRIIGWCEAADLIIRSEMNSRGLKFKPPVVLDIRCHFPKQRGRRPDVANFRAVIQDVVAKAVGIDDTYFSGADTGIWGVDPRKAGFEITIKG